MNIHTEYIPLGGWYAIDTDRYDGAEDAGRQLVGWGKTEADAIADLKEQVQQQEKVADHERRLADLTRMRDAVSNKRFLGKSPADRQHADAEWDRLSKEIGAVLVEMSTNAVAAAAIARRVRRG